MWKYHTVAPFYCLCLDTLSFLDYTPKWPIIRDSVTIWLNLQTRLTCKFIYLFLYFTFNDSFIVVCFLLGNSPASEFCMPTFRNTLSVPTSYLPACEDGRDSVFRNVGIQNSDSGELPRRKHTVLILLLTVSWFS